MKLFLDTTNSRQVVLQLDGEEFIVQYATPQEQNVLMFINETLKKKEKSFDDISQIEVNPGPGSFTGSRVGVAIANALAFALRLKVNGQDPPILPVYSSPPNINV